MHDRNRESCKHPGMQKMLCEAEVSLLIPSPCTMNQQRNRVATIWFRDNMKNH